MTGHTWIIYALGAGLGFGLMGSTFGSSTHYGIPPVLIYGLGALLFNVVYFIYAYIKMKHEGGEFKMRKTAFFDQDTGHFNCGIIIVILFDTITQGLSRFFMVWTFQAAIYASLNQGVVSSFFGLTAPFLAVLGVVIFKERMKFYHYFGVFCLAVMTVLIGFAGSKGKPDDIHVEGVTVER